MTIDIYDEDIAWSGGLKSHKSKVPWVFMDQGPKSDPKIPKSERNEIELRSCHQSIRLDEQIILVGSFVQIGCKMAKLQRSKDWPIMAARGHFGLFRANYWPFCPHFWRYSLLIWFAHYSYQVSLANQFLAQSDLKYPCQSIKTTSLVTWTLWVHFGSIIGHYDPIFRATFL